MTKYEYNNMYYAIYYKIVIYFRIKWKLKNLIKMKNLLEIYMRNGKKSYKFQSKGILKKGLNDSGLGDSFVVS